MCANTLAELTPSRSAASGEGTLRVSDRDTTVVNWAVGIFCALIGALMIVTPHQFGGPAYGPLRPWLAWWGTAFLGVGLALILVGVFRVRRWLYVLVHVIAGGLLLTVASRFTLVGVWAAVPSYAIVGLGTALTPLAPRLLRRVKLGPAACSRRSLG